MQLPDDAASNRIREQRHACASLLFRGQPSRFALRGLRRLEEARDFDVVRLGEHVDRFRGEQSITVLGEAVDVAGPR